MRLLRGNLLSDHAKREALARFVHRHLNPAYANDAEWLSAHAFYVRRDGKLSRAHKRCVPAFFAEYGKVTDGFDGQFVKMYGDTFKWSGRS